MAMKAFSHPSTTSRNGPKARSRTTCISPIRWRAYLCTVGEGSGRRDAIDELRGVASRNLRRTAADGYEGDRRTRTARHLFHMYSKAAP